MKKRVYLQPGREKSVLRRHPWIFASALRSVKGDPQLGETVEVRAHDGQILGVAAFSPHSQIRLRMWAFGKQQVVDRDFFDGKIAQALALRSTLIERQGLTGFRLIAAESDGLPGITVDYYAGVLVCQLLSAGAEYWRETLLDALEAALPGCAIYERSDVESRSKEGLELTQGLLRGQLPAMPVIIEENGVAIAVDVTSGHKTGFYLDQRDNRRKAMDYVANRSVLNCFSYTGTFALYCIKAGASSVENVDVSQPALDMAANNIALNQLDASKVTHTQADVFKLLRQYQEQSKQFDVVIMDPPKFADNRSQLKGACRGYKDINLQAMKLLKPGGTLLTYSCSGLMESDLFQKIVADAALDAGREMQIIERFCQAADHPVAGSFPEGYYLNGLACRIC
ncbi:class I SAM-dependent rRNA methyltransferase [Paraferrimonas sedimenticola]|uniref:Ribosomal RNA large subunit methyltransferase I n=1 Tax=Paraferrimonas sedimenticola TaxID=375674 RepID=A0AA37RZA8_9GAMM|nr:class I SAM-dependent methyltransferase [Paraferrimonas sedimenticola]GLP97893.1 ribosomal RNA large subunit methyltransferase I [Paraferrimonas sedimenticola]